MLRTGVDADKSGTLEVEELQKVFKDKLKIEKTKEEIEQVFAEVKGSGSDLKSVRSVAASHFRRGTFTTLRHLDPAFEASTQLDDAYRFRPALFSSLLLSLHLSIIDCFRTSSCTSTCALPHPRVSYRWTLLTFGRSWTASRRLLQSSSPKVPHPRSLGVLSGVARCLLTFASNSERDHSLFFDAHVRGSDANVSGGCDIRQRH